MADTTANVCFSFEFFINKSHTPEILSEDPTQVPPNLCTSKPPSFPLGHFFPPSALSLAAFDLDGAETIASAFAEEEEEEEPARSDKDLTLALFISRLRCTPKQRRLLFPSQLSDFAGFRFRLRDTDNLFALEANADVLISIQTKANSLSLNLS